MINKHKSKKIKEKSNTVRHLNNGTDHRHSKSCCDQSSPARRTIKDLHIEVYSYKTGLCVWRFIGSYAIGTKWQQPFQWRQNERDGVSNHQPHDCLLNRLFKGPVKIKHQSSASLAFVRGIHRWPMNSPHKGSVMWKMFLFDDVIMDGINRKHPRPDTWTLEKRIRCRVWFCTCS